MVCSQRLKPMHAMMCLVQKRGHPTGTTASLCKSCADTQSTTNSATVVARPCPCGCSRMSCPEFRCTECFFPAHEMSCFCVTHRHREGVTNGIYKLCTQPVCFCGCGQKSSNTTGHNHCGKPGNSISCFRQLAPMCGVSATIQRFASPRGHQEQRAEAMQ